MPVLLTRPLSHFDDGSGVSTWLKTRAGGQRPSPGSLRHPRVNGQRREVRRAACQRGDMEPMTHHRSEWRNLSTRNRTLSAKPRTLP